MRAGLWPVQVFYDGDCSICRRQARQWMAEDRRDRLEFVDIADPGFRAETYGLDPEDVQQSIHVKTADGRVFRGIDAVRVVWTAFPKMWGAALVSGLPGLRGLLEYGYQTLARRRHRQTRSCPEDACSPEAS